MRRARGNLALVLYLTLESSVMNEDRMSILWLRSLRTGRRFPIILFSGDTDMATSGLGALSSTSGREVVATYLTSEEVCADLPTGLRIFEERMNARLGRSDLRYVPIVRVVDEPRADVLYRDIFDPEGEADVVSEESLQQFRATGGVVTLAP